MCTIIVRHRMDDFCSTIIASNRDEFYDRAASGPRVLRTEPLVVGGRDEREGGTWFGLNRDGLFVGLTNQRSFGTRDDSLRSRGGLVLDALAEGSLEGVEQYLRSVDPATYNEFNLIFGDGERAARCVREARCARNRDRNTGWRRARALQRSTRLPGVPEGRKGARACHGGSCRHLAAHQTAARRGACG